MMQRRHDWPERLYRVLLSFRKKKFVYGKTDCACFVTACLGALVEDFDLLQGFKFTYKSERGALRELKRTAGVNNVEELCDLRLGNEVDLNYAQRGDVVSIDSDQGLAIGIILDTRAVFMSRDGGYTSVSIQLCRKAWRI